MATGMAEAVHAGHGCIEGWRDPFVMTTPQSGTSYVMIVGSGYCCDGQKNGCVLQYSARDLAGPWHYDGVVMEGDWHHGRVWECPALVQVSEWAVLQSPCHTVSRGIHFDLGNAGDSAIPFQCWCLPVHRQAAPS